MNRREFIKLLALFLVSVEGIQMLPANSTNRYGDLLKEFYNGIKNDNLSEPRLETIVREFNQLSEREKKYSSWLRAQDGKIGTSFLDLPFNVIYSTTLENNKSELAVSIPPNYKHLLIMGAFRTTKAGASSAEIWAQFNGDTGASNYAAQRLSGSVATASAGMDNTFDKVRISAGASDGAGAGENGFFVAFTPHYTSNTFYKSVIALEGVFINSINTGASAIWTSQWYSTNPITSIRFFPDSDSFKSGSLISVYGIL